MKLFDALRIALPLVTTKDKHKHYKTVCDLSALQYKPLTTGKDKTHLLERFNPREDETMFAQRDRLTLLVTPAVINNTMSPVRKIPKVQPVVNVATFGKDQKEKDDELAKSASTFYGGKGVDHYFGSILLDQGAIDPNAFCLVLFSDFDHQYEKPIPYPTIITSADAWNYEYRNGNLAWLLVHRAIKYKERKTAEAQKSKKDVPRGKDSGVTMMDGHAFWMYTDAFNVMFSQVDKATVGSTVEGVVIQANGKLVVDFKVVETKVRDKYYYRAGAEELYEVSFYQHDSGMVQAFRLGYIPDQTTMGETMVTFWHPAMSYLLKSVKAGSELDLSATLHAFLQKISQLPDCRGYMDANGVKTECNDGYIPGGNHLCKACNGLGKEVHTSGQDHIIIGLARDASERIDIKSLVGYVELPVAILEWQDKYVDKLVKECYAAVYSSDRFKSVNDTTATGDIIDLQSVYDALKPVADWYSMSRVLVYRLVTSMVMGREMLDKLTCVHEFPRNMRFETLGERVQLMEKLRTAGASTGDIAQIEDDVMTDVYADNQEANLRGKVMRSFDPFLGKTEATIQVVMSQNLCTKEEKVLWSNFNYVFVEAVTRAGTQAKEGEVIDFWRMDRKKQREIVDAIVKELVEALDEAADAEMARMQLGTDPNAEQGAPADGNEDLPNSPGNTATGGA